MWNEYAHFKARELEEERAQRHPAPNATPPRKGGHRLAPVAGVAGRRLRRIGEALEQWATPPPLTNEPR